MIKRADFIHLSDGARQVLAEVLDDAPHPASIAIGPVVSDPARDGQWYFVIASGNQQLPTTNNERYWCNTVNSKERDVLERLQASVVLQAMQLSVKTKKSIIIHSFEDELEMAEWCEALWPCSKITSIRKGIQAERKARLH